MSRTGSTTTTATNRLRPAVILLFATVALLSVGIVTAPACAAPWAWSDLRDSAFVWFSTCSGALRTCFPVVHFWRW